METLRRTARAPPATRSAIVKIKAGRRRRSWHRQLGEHRQRWHGMACMRCGRCGFIRSLVCRHRWPGSGSNARPRKPEFVRSTTCHKYARPECIHDLVMESRSAAALSCGRDQPPCMCYTTVTGRTLGTDGPYKYPVSRSVTHTPLYAQVGRLIMHSGPAS